MLPASSSASDLNDPQVGKSQSQSKLASILENQVDPPKDDIHPTQRLRTEEAPSSQEVDDMLDRNLDMMGSSLSQLKMLGMNLQREVEEQNEMIERISDKTQDVDFTIQRQNKDMNRILKK